MWSLSGKQAPSSTKAIPDADINGVTDTQVVADDLVIEAVQLS